MLKSGAHVKLGSYEYLLEESQENHYVHRFETNLVPRLQVVGSPGKAQVRQDKLLWAFDDWSGGEGNKVYYGEDPFVYNYSEGSNPRIRGQLTGRPRRTRSTVTADDTDSRCLLAAADSAVFLAGGQSIAYSTTGTTWTDLTGANIGLSALSANYRITAVAGDNDYLYYSAYHNGASGSRVLKKIAQTGASTNVLAEGTGVRPLVALCVLGGYLYSWTGARLQQIDVFASTPTHTRVSPALPEPPDTRPFSSNWWADCLATENSVLCFTSTPGQSFVYEFRPDGGFDQIWQAPYGFTMKSMAYQNGIAYFAGTWGGTDNYGNGCLYAMSIDSRRPVFIGWFRRNQESSLHMQEMTTSYGSQVMIAAADTGRIFVYDTDMDAISMLDDVYTTSPRIDPTDSTTFTSNERVGSMITYGSKRMVAIYSPGGAGGAGSYQVLSYDEDLPGYRQEGTATNPAETVLYSGRWDYDFPNELKILHGFHIGWEVEDTNTTSGMKAGQQILVEYKLDGGSWTTGATITSSTSPSGSVKGRTFVAISSGSSTAKFFSAEIRVTLTGTRTASTDIQPPILYALTTESSVAASTETWELVIRVKDELPHTRPSSRQWQAKTARDYLEDLAQNKNVITFLDGYRYMELGSYTTHEVVVEDPIDIIQRNAEGVMRIKLRAITS